MKQKEQLPASVQTEVTVLGAMLLDAVAVLDATTAVQPEDFMLDSHQRIYRALLGLAQDNEKIDTITVMEELSRRKHLDAVGGPAYLAFLTEGIPRHPNIEAYVRILKKKSQQRRALLVFNEAAQAAMDEGEDPSELISRVEGQLQRIRMDVVEEATLLDQVNATIESVERQRSGEQQLFIPTGLDAIDSTHSGFALGELTIIAARENVSKSTLLRGATIKNCKQGNFCHIISPEMQAGQLLRLYAAQEAEIHFRRIRHPERMTDADMANFAAALREIAGWPLRIDDESPISPAEAIARARITRFKENTKLLGVDSLQRLEFGGKADQRHTMVADAVRGLKTLAKNEGVAVVLISSLTEVDSKDVNKPPTMANLRQSGDIKYEADTGILLHRTMDSDTRKLVPACSLIFAKGRSDDTGIKEVYFDDDFVRFIDKQQWLAGLGK
jgi:replicative DNA helicase